MSESNIFQFVLLGFLFLVSLIGGFGLAWYYRRERTLTHVERMKALEMGHPPPDDPETARIKAKAARTSNSIKSVDASDQSKSMANQCYATTSYICGGGFFFAFVSGGSMAYALAAAAGAIGVTGMICGTVLATKEMNGNPSSTLSKPSFDPEGL